MGQERRTFLRHPIKVPIKVKFPDDSTVQRSQTADLSEEGMRFDWHEELTDRGNQVSISTSSILGIKKTRFNGKDFGVISIDTAALDPTV